MSKVKTEATAISDDMRALYNSLKAGETNGDIADKLANIAGKNLKSLALIHADTLREDALLKNSGGVA